MRQFAKTWQTQFGLLAMICVMLLLAQVQGNAESDLTTKGGSIDQDANVTNPDAVGADTADSDTGIVSKTFRPPGSYSFRTFKQEEKKAGAPYPQHNYVDLILSTGWTLQQGFNEASSAITVPVKTTDWDNADSWPITADGNLSGGSGGQGGQGGESPHWAAKIATGSIKIVGYPRVPASPTKACYFARCTGAFPVEFEFEDLGESVKCKKIELLLRDIPGKDDIDMDCTNTYIVTPGSRTATMYEGVSVPGALNKKYTLFAASSLWQNIDFDQDHAEMTMQVRAVVERGGYDLTLVSNKITLAFWDRNVEVVEYKVERIGDNRIDLRDTMTRQDTLTKWNHAMVVTHRGNSYDNPTPLARNGDANEYFPDAKELGTNPETDVHETFNQTSFVASFKRTWTATQKYVNVDGDLTLGQSPWSALSRQDWESGTPDIGDDWLASASKDEKCLRAELHPTGGLSDVKYQRISMIATNTIGLAFWTYYRPISVTGVSGINKAVYWNPTGAGDDAATGTMALQLFKGWKWSVWAEELSQTPSAMNWNESQIQAGVLRVTGTAIKSKGNLAHIAVDFVRSVIQWGMGVTLPHGTRPGEVGVEAAMSRADYDSESTPFSKIYAGNSHYYRGSVTHIETSLEINDLIEVVPCRYYHVCLSGVAGCNQTNVWMIPEPYQKCRLTYTSGTEEDFHHVDIVNP